jgi:hypothetical protein
MADPKKDAKGIKKLLAQKKANSVERTDRRLAGNDSKKTRDGGTTRRTWKDPKQGKQ